MTSINMPLFLYNQMNKQRRLAKIWRAIARRHLSRIAELETEADSWFYAAREAHDYDGETDP